MSNVDACAAKVGAVVRRSFSAALARALASLSRKKRTVQIASAATIASMIEIPARVTPHESPESIKLAGWTREHRLAGEAALDVHRKSVCRLVAAGAVFFERLHHDPIQIAAQRADKSRRLDASVFGGRGQVHAGQGA